MSMAGKWSAMFRGLARRGCLPLAMLAVFLPFLALLGLYVQARLLPMDAPTARMYRAESTIAALAHAVEVYREIHGVYPAPGAEGLREAIAVISRGASYFGGDLPLDPWDRPYRYVPSSHYGNPGSGALKDQDGRFFAPDSFQIYSVGADGDAGEEDENGMRDNITSWDERRGWRSVYRELTRAYFEQKRQ